MIENTTSRDSLVHLLGAMADGTDKYITDMEAAGQQQIVSSSQLPKKGPWPEAEALGFIRGDDVPGDDLFVFATLPDGWKKVATDHAMHSKIVDEREVERVSVFYKAAFYDRRADFHIVNVGYQLASDAIWGDGAVKLPASWSKLTDNERADYANALARGLADEHDHRPWITGAAIQDSDEKIRRIEALLVLIPTQCQPAADRG
ncbi:hypothetical protein [Nocardia sp. NPDC059239]|uniref:hypothetical protein n=1 Tax=unclassified Nocardia TaxID=2637762 RepID=UPI00369303CE